MTLPKRSIKHLISKIDCAKELGLIEDFTLVNRCEVDAYITIIFHAKTPAETKRKLAEHIQNTYEDIINIRFTKCGDTFLVKYDDWETLPDKVAF